MLFFGPSSLGEKRGKKSGPKPCAISWGLREVTPGAIALAAILVSVPFWPLRMSIVLIELCTGSVPDLPGHRFFNTGHRLWDQLY